MDPFVLMRNFIILVNTLLISHGSSILFTLDLIQSEIKPDNFCRPRLTCILLGEKINDPQIMNYISLNLTLYKADIDQPLIKASWNPNVSSNPIWEEHQDWCSPLKGRCSVDSDTLHMKSISYISHLTTHELDMEGVFFCIAQLGDQEEIEDYYYTKSAQDTCGIFPYYTFTNL